MPSESCSLKGTTNFFISGSKTTRGRISNGFTNVAETTVQSEESLPHYVNEEHYGTPGKAANWLKYTRYNPPTEQLQDSTKTLQIIIPVPEEVLWKALKFLMY